MGRPNQAIEVGKEDQEQLEAIARSRSPPHSLVTRAKIVLYSARGKGSNAVAELAISALRRCRIGVGATVGSGWRACMMRSSPAARAASLTRR